VSRVPRSPEPNLDVTNPLANPRARDWAPDEVDDQQLPNDPPPREEPGQPTNHAPRSPGQHPLGPVEPLP
jgi:hypothetical protein